MGVLAKLFGYRDTPRDRGIGVQTVAFLTRQMNGVADLYSPYRMVRRSMKATRPAKVKFEQAVPSVPIEGNGSYIQGVFAMQALMDLEREKAKTK